MILVISFLSQQPYARDLFKNISSNLNKYSGASLLGGLNFYSPNPLDSGDSTNTSTNNGANNSTNGNTDNIIDSYKLTESSSSSAKTNILKNIDFSIVDKAKMAIPSISEIPQKVTDVIKSGGEIIANSINNAKENISTAEKKVVNYFSEISDAIQGKENNSVDNQCPTGQ